MSDRRGQKRWGEFTPNILLLGSDSGDHWRGSLQILLKRWKSYPYLKVRKNNAPDRRRQVPLARSLCGVHIRLDVTSAISAVCLGCSLDGVRHFIVRVRTGVFIIPLRAGRQASRPRWLASSQLAAQGETPDEKTLQHLECQKLPLLMLGTFLLFVLPTYRAWDHCSLQVYVRRAGDEQAGAK